MAYLQLNDTLKRREENAFLVISVGVICCFFLLNICVDVDRVITQV